MACKKGCLSYEEVQNLINKSVTSSVPLGAKMFTKKSIVDQYFDSSGLGFSNSPWDGWAIANGSNGTENLLGKFIYFYDPSTSGITDSGLTGGATSVTLSIANLPSHNHSGVTDSHTHPVTDSGHSHTGTTDLGLTSPVSIGANSSQSATLSATVSLNRARYNVDASSPTILLEPYIVTTTGAEVSGTFTTENVAIVGNATVPAHTHPDLSLSHSHAFSTSVNTTGIGIGSTAINFTTNNTGSGTAFSILPPYITQVPVEKIS